MLRLRWILPAVLLTGAIVTSSVLASADLTKPGVVRITNRELTSERVDVGVSGESSGDLLIRTQLLFNRRITERPLGHEEMICTYVGRGGVLGGGTRNCQMEFYLPQGRLLASGDVHNLLFFSLPVVGGTGIYDNVGGSLTVTYLGANPRRQLLLLRLTI
jgi:hypothetical protein